MENFHWKLIVTGRVQGVAFRAYARDKANELGIRGFVKNLPDGSVLIEAEGTEQQLLEYYNWSKKGPSWARVDQVKQTEEPIRAYKNFSIKY